MRLTAIAQKKKIMLIKLCMAALTYHFFKLHYIAITIERERALSYKEFEELNWR